jgi:septal ring factor EnvC (AmiA/AmiB activator)
MLNFLLMNGLMNGGKFSKIATGVMIASLLFGFVVAGALVSHAVGFIPKYNETRAEIEAVREEIAVKQEAHALKVAEAEDRIAEIRSKVSEIKSSRESLAAEASAFKDSVDAKRAESEKAYEEYEGLSLSDGDLL